MSTTARDALLREVEAVEAALRGAEEAYAEDSRRLHEAQKKSSRSYEARAEIRRNLDRLKLALALVEGDASNEVVAELNRQARA